MVKAEVADPRVQGRPRLTKDDELLTLQEVAAMLEVSENTVYYWRYQRTGPKGHKIGRQVRYWRSDVLAWMRERGDRVSGLKATPRR